MERKKDSISNVRSLVTSIVAISMSLFHLYTASFGVLPAMQQRSAHVAFALTLIVLLNPIKIKGQIGQWLDRSIIALVIIFSGYVFLFEESIALRIGAPTILEIILGFIALIILIEVTWRTQQRPLAKLALAFLAYLFIGNYLPGLLKIREFPMDIVVTSMYLSIDGIYGMVTGVSAKIIFIFILFGYFLKNFGLGEFFINFAASLAGGIRGGPAQVSVIGSCLFGMVSGSAVANVAGIGSFTIPMMKRMGFPPTMAGATEAAASTGGQFMPPVMASAAFIIAEVLGISYLKVCLAALIPALLYFISVAMMLYLDSVKMGLKTMPKEERPKLRKVMKEGWYLILPVITLLYLLVLMQYSPMYSAFYSILCMVIVDLFVKRDIKKSLNNTVAALREGAKAGVEMAALCACSSVIVGVFDVTGKGLELSSVLVDISMGSLFLLLLISMVASIILGMPLPTTPCYIFLAVTVAPSLVNSGVLPIAAHLFVFYYGIFSVLTLPVAPAAFAAAAIAESPMVPTAMKAMKYSLAGYILPFIYVYRPALLLEGDALTIIGTILWALVIMGILAMILCGQFLQKINTIGRIILGLSMAGLLSMENPVYQVLSTILLMIVLAGQMTHLRVFRKLVSRGKKNATEIETNRRD